MSRYRALLAIPGFRRLVLGAIAGRLPSGMFSLAILLLVHARTGSFATAGLALAAYTLAGAVAGPVLARAVDRRGQTRVLGASASVQAAAAILLALSVQLHVGASALVLLAAAIGASQPPLAGCIRALWPEVATDEHTLQTIHSLDATSQELIWTLGPLLVGAAAALIAPQAGVVLCAAITLAGTALFATSRHSRAWRPVGREQSRGALASPGLPVLLVTVALAGLLIGAGDVGLPALAAARHSRWAAGPLLAAFSLGSMAGGLAYAARAWRVAPVRRYGTLLLGSALALIPLLAAPPLPAAVPLAFLAGLALAPLISTQLTLVGALSTPASATEAFTWHRSATIAGMAIGSALAGMLVQRHGPGAAFAPAIAALVIAWILTQLWRDRIGHVAVRQRLAPAAPGGELVASEAS